MPFLTDMQYNFCKIMFEEKAIILLYASAFVGYQKNRMGVIMLPTDVARDMSCHFQLPGLGQREVLRSKHLQHQINNLKTK